ncbi:non-ribosomal peptide synthetase [Lewinella sp. JB7]|uniref:non-ribosomal peptide synthetase n=1 Tax=Lewinella sp. JB7 TaxID=2962887 RepID=UPI0020C9FE79|nr:non-ribosomal peptide synthetase [Lewinella sp. JB7]MCP9234767.1 amino acid adenylation domain-containing protein [Lewinella sp. JB7]
MSNTSLLSRWLGRNKGTDKNSAPARDTSDYPTTYGQQRIWALCQLSPDDPFYNSAEAYRIVGDLDPERLRAAYADLIRRHESLRTVFYEQDGTPRQRVLDESPTDFQVWDGRNELATDRAGRIRSFVHQPFDLGAGPLSRMLVIREGADTHTVVVVLHHIISDEAAMAVFRTELAAGYRGGVSLPPLPIQYGTMAVRQRQRDHTESLAYWQNQLREAPATSTLPAADWEHGPTSRYAGELIHAELGGALTARILSRSQEARTTPFLYLLAAYYVLLEAQSGQADLLVGTPVTNRDRKEYEPLIGFMNETVLLRQRLDLSAGFDGILRQLQATFYEALAHKDTPFEHIVKQLNPERMAGVNPLFQTMFLHPEASPPPDFGPATVTTYESLDPGTAKFDLTLSVTETANGYRVTAEYATARYGAARIERLLAHYRTLLDQVTTDPTRPLTDLQLIVPEEWDQLRDWNAACITPPATLVDRLITDHARTSPEATAATAGSEHLNYRELDRRSAALAAVLTAGGIRVGEIVGLHTRRGPEMIVGIVGILRAGAAYLPLDPEYPADRLDFMIGDSGARWIVADTAARDVPGPEGVSTVYLDRLSPVDAPPEPADRSPDDPAYIIYTSGSTGSPKGVVVSHRNLLHSTLARGAVYGAAPEVFLLLSSFSFDSSVAGIFWTLTGGGCLVIAPERAEQDMRGLSRLIAERGVTHTLLLPTLYGHLLQYGEPARLASLGTVTVAGEACSPTMVREHFARLPDVRLFNEYGPTEATVWSSVHRVTEADGAAGSVPIGRAVPGYQIYVTDDHGRILPPGVVGELCVAGAGVVGGYRNRPDLTAERFAPLTLPDGTKPRAYRTGDLARYRDDGSLIFLGRKDRQVKLRGYRVEPEEVRNVLLADPGVRDAEVLVDQQRNRLLGYVVLESGTTANALEARLAAQLPTYLLPVIQPLEVLPRLPNGKVDGGALATTTPAAKPTNAPVPAADATEAALLEVWRTALGQEDIGVTDNFFSLGGDSILSIQIIARARRAGWELSPTAIFDRQTVRELARTAVAVSARETPASAQAYHGPVPLTPIQHWFFAEHRTAPHHWNHAWCFELGEGTDPARVAAVARRVYDESEGLRQNFACVGGEWTATIAAPGSHDCYTTTDEHLPAFLDRLQADLDLSRSSLFRVVLFPADPPGRPVVLLFAHHLVIDMVSWSTVVAAFSSALAPAAPPPAPLIHGAGYHLWARQLKEWATAGKFLPELDFWAAQHCPPVLDDQKTRLPVRQETVATDCRTVGARITRAVLQDANVAYGTRPEELLLTAVLLAVARETKADVHGLNLERHGREPLDSGLAVQETPGWFTVSYPLTFSIGPETETQRAVVAVKETLRAVPNNGIGYGVLRYLGPRPELAQSPAIYFNYLGQRSVTGGGALERGRFMNSGLRHPGGEFNRVWEINVEVVDQEVQFHWSYGTELHDRTTVERLLASTAEYLETIVTHCLGRRETTVTPSDFPEADLSAEDLDGLFSELNL